LAGLRHFCCVFLLVAAVDAGEGDFPRFAGAQNCARCHTTEAKAWRNSAHGQHAQPRADLPKGAVGAVGSRWMQAYLRRDEQGHHRIDARCYDLREKRWRDVEGVLKEIRGTPLPGSPKTPDIGERSFDLDCAGCHSSQSRLRRDLKTRRLDTRWVDLAINCEACHGAGGEHAKSWSDLGGAGAPMVRLQKLSPRRQNAVCARCHGGRQAAGDFGPEDTRGYLAILRDRDGYFPDGTASGQLYQYSSFSRSPCYLEGNLTCNACHDPHGPGLKRQQHADALCTRCHEGMASRAHTHHDMRKDGARCIECHMPKLLGGVMAHQRDHRISIPLPASPHVPDACTACHKDKDKAWADRMYRERWGDPPKRTLDAIQAIVWARKRDTRAPAALRRVLRHKDPFFRANAALYLGNPDAVKDDAVPEVRFAVAGLRPRLFLDDVEPMVRAAAMLGLSEPMGSERAPDLALATRHMRNLPRADLALGLLDLRQGRIELAATRFHRVLAWRPKHVDAWAGLARTLDAQARPKEAKHAHTNRALLLHGLVRAQPWEADLAVEAARAYASAGRSEDARALLRKVRSRLRTPEAHRKVGAVLRELEGAK
jgi:predicted CXXCH cytochrome family protein